MSHLITDTELLSIADVMGATYDLLTSALSSASTEAQKVADRVIGKQSVSYGIADAVKHQQLDSPAQAFSDMFTELNFWRVVAYRLIAGFQNNIQQYGKDTNISIRDIDTFATYFNSQSARSVLFSTSFARLYYLFANQTKMLSPDNVIMPSVLFGSGTITGVAAVTFVNGDAIPSANDVVNGTQGCIADVPMLKVTSGTLTGTVTITGIDQTGASAYWDAIVEAMDSEDTAIAFTPRVAGKMIRDVTACSYTGNGVTAVFSITSASRAIDS